MKENITPLILTYNEEDNISRTLDKLMWASDIVVLDSGSTDRTKSICEGCSNVRFIVRSFDNHASQWEFGLKQTGIDTPWVLALDADHVLSDDLIYELDNLEGEEKVSGYSVSFIYCMHGKPLHGSLYPPVVSLFRREKAHYIQDGHTQRVVVKGNIGRLSSKIFHDDRKSLVRWLGAQERYAYLEAKLILGSRWRSLRWQDRLRKLIVVAPFLVPFYCFFMKKGFFDGWYGLFYGLQRGLAECILSLKLIELGKINVNKDSE